MNTTSPCFQRKLFHVLTLARNTSWLRSSKEVVPRITAEALSAVGHVGNKHLPIKALTIGSKFVPSLWSALPLVLLKSPLLEIPMRSIVLTVAVLGTLLGLESNVRSAPNIIFFRGDSYAAIAFSEKTGRYGYTYDQMSRDIAEVLARRRCRNGDPKVDDAKVVGWVHNGWVALARGDNGAWGVGYSHGNGATNKEAKERALAECRKRGKNAKLVVCVCSLNRKPEVFE